MTDFSASDAAIEGFRLAGRKPLAVLIWSLAQLVFALASGAVFVLLVGPELQAMMRPDASAGWADPAQAIAMLAGAARVEALAVLIFLPWVAVQTCAVYRAVLRPDDTRFGYLRLGRDELRMIGLFLIMLALMIGLFMALIVVAVVVGGVAGAVLGGALHLKPAALTGLAIVLGVAPWLAFVWIMVRLSLAAPMTFAERRLRPFASWKLTRGRFWALFGAYFLSLVLCFVVVMIGYPLALLIGHLATGEGFVPLFQSMSHPDYASLQAHFSTSRLVVLALQALYSGLTAAIVYAPAAAAYRMLAGVRDTARPPSPGETDAPARAPTGPWG